jgi:hypothetical protein
MSIFEPKFETYQDVKTTLTWWSIPFWLAMLLAIYFGIMPPDHRATLKTLFPGLTDWVGNTGSFLVAVALAGALSQFMIHVVEVHDRVYDRFVVKWRQDYDVLFILPSLLKPLEHDVPLAALSVAQANRQFFMERLYYNFVGDRDMKIRKNLVVRFYEVITKYWLTQLLEVAALLVVLVDVVYALADRLLGRLMRPTLYWTLVAALAVWVLARVSALLARPRVARHTTAQIEAIHKDCAQLFRTAVSDSFREQGIDVATS